MRPRGPAEADVPPAARRVVVAHPSPDVYGSDRQLLETVGALVDAAWDVDVYLPHAGPLCRLLVQRGARVRVHAFPVLRKALLRPAALVRHLRETASAALALRRHLRSDPPALVLVNTITIPVWLAGARLARVPALVHVHEAEDSGNRLMRVALAAPNVLARAVIANSRAAAAALGVVPGLGARTEVIHNGVPGPPDGAAPARDRDTGDPLELVVVGRLSPRKGIDVALEAAALLRARGVDARLRVCGSVFPGYEWYEDELRARAARDDLAGAVALAGYVHPTWPALADADVVLVPSRVEPFGNTAVEAMHARRPVVASGVQGLREVVTDGVTGLLVEPDDAVSLADAVELLAQDPPLAHRLARAAADDAARRFSVATYADRVVDAVRRAASR